MFLSNHKEGIKKSVIKIPSDIKYIRKISSKLLKSLERHNLGEDRLFDIRLAVEEALRNAIVHGNRKKRDLAVRFAWWVEDKRLVIEVRDEGPGFDHRNLPDPTEADNILKSSGRGVYLIRHLMDEVAFNDSGNTIKMVKYLR